MIHGPWQNYLNNMYYHNIEFNAEKVDQAWSKFLNCSIFRNKSGNWEYFEWDSEEEYLLAVIRLMNWDGKIV